MSCILCAFYFAEETNRIISDGERRLNTTQNSSDTSKCLNGLGCLGCPVTNLSTKVAPRSTSVSRTITDTPMLRDGSMFSTERTKHGDELGRTSISAGATYGCGKIAERSILIPGSLPDYLPMLSIRDGIVDRMPPGFAPKSRLLGDTTPSCTMLTSFGALLCLIDRTRASTDFNNTVIWRRRRGRRWRRGGHDEEIRERRHTQVSRCIVPPAYYVEHS